ncbi:MAG TPA: metalloregulator ArsR/SmtB family transcription factor [Jiangellales bacterium]|nr:metalloregulator ArsR/SmtB family transcription factor [Jiangellales bacterium]
MSYSSAASASEYTQAVSPDPGSDANEFVLEPLGVLPHPEAPAFLGVVPSSQLLALHHAVHDAIQPVVKGIWHHYRPNALLPHCTLAVGVTDKARTMQIVARFSTPIPALVASAHLVEMPGGHSSNSRKILRGGKHVVNIREFLFCNPSVTLVLMVQQAFEALADPTRRRIVELLVDGERTAGQIADQFPVSRPAVSRHLRVLRETGLVRVREEAQRRLYALDTAPLKEVDAWLGRYRGFWSQRLDALETEIARRRRDQRDRKNQARQ